MFKYILGIGVLYYIFRPKSEPEPCPLSDIVIGPGGVQGFYSLGVCHYIVNHFKLSDKSIIGFSSGAFTAMFMRIESDKRNELLRGIFNCYDISNICILKKIIHYLVNNTKLDDYNMELTSVGVSHLDDIHVYNQFLNIEHAVRCCQNSCFVPFITVDNGLQFYNHKIAFDGYLYYNSFLEQYTTRPLIITPRMFGRFNNAFITNLLFVFGIHDMKYTTIYQLYLLGYRDASNNHSFFEDYLEPIHSSS